MDELKEEALVALVRRAVEGEAEASHLLYQHFVARIFNFVIGLVRVKEDAEDITQDAFVQAFQNMHALKDLAKFEQWLYRIARNEVYQRFRRKKTAEVPLDTELITSIAGDDSKRADPNPEDQCLGSELSKVIEGALSDLPLKMREVFILSVVHDKSYKEISEIVNRSLLAVKTDIYRARVFAKDAIKKYTTRG